MRFPRANKGWINGGELIFLSVIVWSLLYLHTSGLFLFLRGTYCVSYAFSRRDRLRKIKMKKENQCVTVRQRAGQRLRVVRGRMFTIISIHDYPDTDNSPFSTYCEGCLLRSATKTYYRPDATEHPSSHPPLWMTINTYKNRWKWEVSWDYTPKCI